MAPETSPCTSPIERVRRVCVTAYHFDAPYPVIARVSQLRNVAVSLVETPLFAFLDDDNFWTADHLSTLARALAKSRSLAAHSWRRVITAEGRPWDGGDFPWAPPGEMRRRTWRRMVEEGVIRIGEDVIRDRARMADGSPGMVDLGAWLFRTELLRLAPLCTRYDANEFAPASREGHKLLQDLVKAGLETPCTGKATLVYRLGGVSNCSSSPPAAIVPRLIGGA